MNTMYLSDEAQAKRLARALAQEPGIAEVKLYRNRDKAKCLLTFECAHTPAREAARQARAARALEMEAQGYRVLWAGDQGLVVGPKAATRSRVCICYTRRKTEM